MEGRRWAGTGVGYDRTSDPSDRTVLSEVSARLAGRHGSRAPPESHGQSTAAASGIASPLALQREYRVKGPRSALRPPR